MRLLLAVIFIAATSITALPVGSVLDASGPPKGFTPRTQTDNDASYLGNGAALKDNDAGETNNDASKSKTNNDAGQKNDDGSQTIKDAGKTNNKDARKTNNDAGQKNNDGSQTINNVGMMDYAVNESRTGRNSNRVGPTVNCPTGQAGYRSCMPPKNGNGAHQNCGEYTKPHCKEKDSGGGTSSGGT